jgi:hypothetical protein
MRPVRPIPVTHHALAAPKRSEGGLRITGGRNIKLGPKGLKQLSRRARRALQAHPAARREGPFLWIAWSDYHAIKATHPPRLWRECFFLPLGWLLRRLGFKRPGDTVSRLARPVARALGLSCIDPATKNLRPGSPCAKVLAQMNRAKI